MDPNRLEDQIIDLKWRLELDAVRPKQKDRIWKSLMKFFPKCGSMDHSDALKKMTEMLEEDDFVQAKSYINYMERINMRLHQIEMTFSTTTESQIASHGMQSQVASPNDTIVSDGAKRSDSLSSALPSMTSTPTQTSVPKNDVAGLNKKSGIAKEQFSSQESQQHHQLMKQNPPIQSWNVVGRRSIKRQSETAHAQDLFQQKKQHQLMNPQLFSSPHGMQSQGHQLLSQNDTIVSGGAKMSSALPSMTSTLTKTSVPKTVVAGLKKKSESAKEQFPSQELHHHQLMKQNLLQPTQMSNDVGRSSTNTQSETVGQKQQLMKQNLLQPTQMPNVVGRSTNTQSEIAHAQDADDWKEEFYQKVQALKQRYLPHLKAIHEKTKERNNDSVSNVPQSERQKLLDLEKHMKILNMPRDDVIPALKDCLPNYEKRIIHVIKSYSPREPVSAQHKIQQPGSHPLPTQPRQQQQQQERLTTNQMQPKKS